MSERIIIVTSVICSLVCTIGIACSVIGIYANGNKFLSNDQSCPINDLPNDVTFTKQYMSQWKWTYSYNNWKIQQKCFSSQGDVNLLKDGILVSRSDYKILSLTSLAFVYDCHHNTIYTIETANVQETLINMNGIWVSVLIKDKDNNIIGYVKSTQFFNSDIYITDAKLNNETVHMVKNYFKYPWTWIINVFNNQSVISDYRIITLIAGHSAFTEDSDSTDICNEYVLYSFIITLTVIVIFLVGICYMIYSRWNYVKNTCCQKYRSNQIYDVNLNRSDD
jgi:hypothetical protein